MSRNKHSSACKTDIEEEDEVKDVDEEDEDIEEEDEDVDEVDEDIDEDDDAENGDTETKVSSKQKAKQHVEQLQRLQEKDPEFYQYLKDFDKKLLEFDDKEIEDDEDLDDDKVEGSIEASNAKESRPSKVITMDMVDRWCKGIKDGDRKPIRSIIHAFHVACHYDVAREDGSAPAYTIPSSAVFNKIMVFVLTQMDSVLRELLKAPPRGGRKETVLELMNTRAWRSYGKLMRSYLGNALQILTEMTDEQMITFTLKHVKASAVFLAAFPSLMRKYVKVALHTWGSGKGAMPVVSLLFLRDLCVQLGTDVLGTCLRGMYKAYVSNCKLAKTVTSSKQQQIQFLVNCVTELYGVDPPSAYQHAFLFIRQLAIILRGVHNDRGSKPTRENNGKAKDKKDKVDKSNTKTTEKQSEKIYQKVYDWQYIYCLELWTNVVCTYNSDADFGHLAYPLAQIISGVACLVPTARYIPLRLRCVRMLNRIAKATGAYIPVSSLLLDMLDMKELRLPPTGGVGKAVDLFSIKQVDKTALKTRSFQEACIYSITEKLAEHFAQWSYSAAFFELSFLTLVRLRSFLKTIKADRFRGEIKELIDQIELNCKFTNAKRAKVDFSPNDPAAESFLEAEKEAECSPLSIYAKALHDKSRNRSDAMVQSSVVVGSESSFATKLPNAESTDNQDNGDEEEGAAIFSLPDKNRDRMVSGRKSKKRSREEDAVATEEDVVEDLVLSSDEEDDETSKHADDALDSEKEAAESSEGDDEEGRMVSTSEGKKKKPFSRKGRGGQSYRGSSGRSYRGSSRKRMPSRPPPRSKKMKR